MNSYAMEDIVNLGLRDGGIPWRISDVYEGSEAARIALEIFGQSRDELLRTQDWSFSRRVAALTLLKGPPPQGGYTPATPWSDVYPYPGFLYEYSYPSDMLDLRAIISPPGMMPDLDPLPAEWRIDDDPLPNVSGNPPVASGPEAKVILCNITNAMAVYRAQVTLISTWEPLFISALVASLGRKYAKDLGADVNTQREDSAEAVVTTQQAGSVRG
jgi:hypothetical protein